MKRFYLLMTSLMLLLGFADPGAFATSYQIWHNSDGNWDTWSGINLTEHNGKWYYQGQIPKCNFGIRKLNNNGDQEAYYKSTQDNTTVNINQYNSGSASSNKNNWWLANAGSYTLVFDPSNGNLFVTQATRYSIKAGWDSSDNWYCKDMQYKDGKWVLTAKLSTGNFGIQAYNSENKEEVYLKCPEGNTTVNIDTPMPVSNEGNNWYVNSSETYTFTYDPFDLTLKVSKQAKEKPTKYFIHAAAWDGSSDWSDKEMSLVNGVWVLTAKMKPGDFGIKGCNNSNEQLIWVSSANGSNVSMNTPLQGKVDGTNWHIDEEHTYTFTYDSVTMKLTVTQLPDPIEQINAHMPLTAADFANGRKHYFFVGTRTADWSLQPEWELNVAGNLATLNGRIFYTGLVGIAVVDNYKDYVSQRYTLYTSNQKYVLHQAFQGQDNNIRNCGTFMARNVKDHKDDYANRTWDNTISIINNTNNGATANYNDDAILKADPYQGDILVKLDNNGNPTSLYLNNYKKADYTDRIFALVGGQIYMQGDNDIIKTRAHVNGDYTGLGWQDGWVQFDENGKFYYDIYGNPVYQTVYQNSWLKDHKSSFRILGKDGGKDFDYSSEQITFVNATALDQEGDPYRALYNRFNIPDSEKKGEWNVFGIENGKKENPRHVTTNGLDYYEYVTSNGQSENKVSSNNWQCFVVKDMWMEGTFKIWSGFGGNTKRNEGGTDPKDDENWRKAARWFYDNGGHGVKGNFNVSGYDYKATTQSSPIQNYGLQRDVDGADFNITNRTYFKRVILWYNPEKGFDESVLQLVVEKYGPAIQNFRTDKNHLNYSWMVNFGGELGDGKGEDAKLDSYTIIRHYLSDDSDNGTIVEENVPLDGKLVAELGTVSANDNAALAPGDYRYEIILTFKDGAKRTALSNIVTIYKEQVPVTAVARQRVENSDGTTLYSFDIQLDVDTEKEFRERKVTLENNEINMIDMVSDYVIFVDEATAGILNKATTFTVNGKAESKAFEKAKASIYSGDPAHPYEREGYMITVTFDKDNSLSLQWDNIDPTRTYDFDVYLTSNNYQQTLAEMFVNLNYLKAFASTGLYIPRYTATLNNLRIDADETVSDDVEQPVAQMPTGARLSKTTDNAVAPVRYSKANALRADLVTSAIPVTKSVTDKWTVTKSVKVGDMTVSTGNAAATNGTFRHLPLPVKAEKTLPDGALLNEYSSTEVKLASNAALSYVRGDFKAQFNDCGTSSAQLTLPALASPTAVINKVYLAGVKHDENSQPSLDAIIDANITFDTDLTAVAGYHISASHEAYISGISQLFHPKAVDGGSVVDQDTPYASDIRRLDGYHHYLAPKFTSGSYSIHTGDYSAAQGYDNNIHNWAELAVSAQCLPLHIHHLAHAVHNDAQAEETFKQKVSAISYYAVYPFVVNNVNGDYTDNSTNAVMLDATPGNTVVSLPVESSLGTGNLSFATTGVSDIVADTDDNAEYYNLQGINVPADCLVPGVYIRRTATSTAKVIVR